MPRPESSSTNNASCEVEALRQQVEALTLENEHLKLLVAKYRRMHFGQKAESQEQLGQLDLALAYDPLAIQVAESMKPSPVANDAAVEKRSSKRKPFPETLPRETVKYMPQATCCPDCGGQFKPLGEDVSEMLEYVPASFKVIRHVRPKLACVHCDHIAQADAPPRPIPRGMAGPALLAHMLVGKFCDHCVLRTRPPLFRWKRCFTKDEGRPLEVGLQEQASNRHKLRALRAPVVSVAGNGGARLRQVGFKETNASEPLMTCRNVYKRRRNREGVVGPGQGWGETCLLPNWRPA